MKNILVCDDDEMIIEVTKIILGKKGYSVFTLSHVGQLLENVIEIKPNLILMDLNIPPAGGEAAIKSLKENAATKNIPVLVFSANPEIEALAEKINSDGYIKKPFDISEFENTIEIFLESAK